ncbi:MULTISPECIES: hypothetical protein [Bacillus]|uniref:Uncharacterized protein n=1 Tax=Bacillus mycoides TaxID=1405 RepID=A0A1E8B7J3_BACMY|nr:MULTISPECIES: hypothetical protein [Bacillus cereus group]OFD76092.1 hypothetical protein BWGOE9_34490 [Bacillus mycoides]OFD79274.1 hypothetical protein BWGOE8_25320 [Bacillus mycoides]OFD81774.1 hypothetical protein BWGOE10_23950 [Bacillus mycoides]
MKKWTIWGIIFYIHSVILLYLGFDRLGGYRMSDEFSDLNKYVYVGGDAYNYIINSNVLTGYFVLSGSFFVAGTMLIATGSILRAIKGGQEVKTEQSKQIVKQDNTLSVEKQ